MRPSLRRLARPGPALVGVTLVGLLARFFALGARVAHQDEARVGHWILHYLETGTWEYRAIIHGPFIPHVNGVVFSTVGPSDFTARLVVAVVGGLLPLAAWLLRDRLDDVEVVALGLLLAANPVLLYYSRFMRNDLLVAAFMLFAVAFFVRTVDTGRARYLYAGAAAFALAFTTKENALLYPVTWLGATALLLDHRLSLARRRDDGQDWVAVLTAHVERTIQALWAWKLHLAVVVVEAVVIFVAFYAPKPDLWQALAGPSGLPDVLQAATVGVWKAFAETWTSPGMHGHPYLPYLGYLLDVLWKAALPLSLLSALGFLADRYAGDRPRDLVAFGFYWGVASLLGYPLVVDINAPWTTIHVLVPLAVPAAVGLALVYRRARGVIAADDLPSATAAAALLLALGGTFYWGYATALGLPVLVDPNAALAATYAAVPVPAVVVLGGVVLAGAGVFVALFERGSAAITTDRRPARVAAALVLTVAAVNVGTVAVDTAYRAPQAADNPLAQYAQPSGQMRPTLEEIERIAAENDGVDVLYYGDEFHNPETRTGAVDPGDPGWFARLPLPWYFEQYGANVSSTNDSAAVLERRPPVVVALGPDAPDADDTSADFADDLEGYDAVVYQQYLWSRPLVFYVDSDLRRP